MFRKVLSVLTLFAILANQAIAVASHSHGEPPERTSRPHIHLGGHTHSHYHQHGYAHDHDRDHAPHHNHGDDHPNSDTIAPSSPSHDCDAVFVAESDVVLTSEERSVENSVTVKMATILDLSIPKVPSTTQCLKRAKLTVPLAHARLLRKIRLLL